MRQASTLLSVSNCSHSRIMYSEGRGNERCFYLESWPQQQKTTHRTTSKITHQSFCKHFSLMNECLFRAWPIVNSRRQKNFEELKLKLTLKAFWCFALHQYTTHEKIAIFIIKKATANFQVKLQMHLYLYKKLNVCNKLANDISDLMDCRIIFSLTLTQRT